jgi:DNA helicase-2/ATP-dependent DNA helicase PcrA
MQASEDEHIRTLALFLIELGVASQTAPLEIILDTLIGSREHPRVPEGDHDDEDFVLPTLTLSTTYTSPYKEYYFGKDALKHDGSAYIHFLSSLKVFVHALREYKDGNLLRVHDVGDFVDMHTAYKIPLTNETAFAHNEHSVQLLTSHGAKGLEFDVVFIIAVHDSVWAGKPKGSKLSFPVNLPLASAGDAEDDFIRLLYVALTRARHTLYLSHHASKLRFLNASILPDTDEHTIAPPESSLLVEGLHVYQRAPFAEDERALLQKVVEGYMLSPTHLNNFLHIIEGGPMKFLEQNLLRFPQAKTSSSVYGTAIHAALEHAIILTKKTGSVPPLETLLDVFRKELHRGRLLPYEEENKRSRGEKVLKRYYELRKGSITGNELVELNFARQAVVVGGALLTGKIDRVIEHEDGSWTVVDVKTGKGYASFDDGTTAYDKIKLHHYRYQLLMYKLLVEHSRDYAHHSVTSALLEFVEEETDGTIQEIMLDLRAIDQAEYERFKQLVQVVYTKIVSLDLTLDTSGYEQTLDGIKAFEDDLIAGRI